MIIERLLPSHRRAKKATEALQAILPPDEAEIFEGSENDTMSSQVFSRIIRWELLRSTKELRAYEEEVSRI